MIIKFSEETVDHAEWVAQTAQLGDLVITLGKSKKALSDSAEFLPNRVMKGKEVLWRFDKSYVGCFAFLREVNGEWIVVYTSKQEVADVIPILDLANAIQLADGQYDWKRPALERLELKLAAATLMNLKARLSPVEMILERKLAEMHAKAAAERSAALREEEQQRYEARRAEKQARKKELMTRMRTVVYTANGDKKVGIPVVGDEWQSLGDGVDCVAVASYTDGQATSPTEHFFVKKEGSKKTRQRLIAVFAEDPRKPQLVEQMGEIVVEVKGQTDVVSCYTREGLQVLKANGLNSGAIRGVWPANSDGTHTLVSFSKGDIKDIGNFSPLT
jgi:hypothetical protein